MAKEEAKQVAEKAIPARARAILTADEQVDHIVRLMVTREWRAGRSHKMLAEEWDCHPQTVAERARIASGFLVRAGGTLETWVAGKMQALEELEHQAAIGGDVKAAILAIRLQAEIRGVLTRQMGKKPGESNEDARAAFLKMTGEERIAELKAAIAEEEAKLKGDMH